MTTFGDRFGGFTPYGVTPDDYKSAMLKKAMGVTLGSSPMDPIVPRAVSTVPVTPPDPTAAPIRMPSQDAVDSWRSGADQDIKSGDTANPPMPPLPVKPPAAFPPADAPAVPYTNPVVQSGPGGVTLNSSPAAPGWAGTVGMPAPTPDYQRGQMDEKLTSGLEEMAKGIRPKVAPSPMPAVPQLEANNPSQLAYQLLTGMMQGKKNRGVTLTG